MVCKECKADLKENETICHWCGAENKALKGKNRRRKMWPLVMVISTIFLVLLSLGVKTLIQSIQAQGEKQLIDHNGYPLPDGQKENQPTAAISPVEGNTNNAPNVSDLPIYYMKGNRLYSGNLRNFNPRTVVNSLFVTGDKTSDAFYISEDGSRLFYPQNHLPQVQDYQIFRYDLKAENGERKRMLTDVNGYTINQDGTRMYYFKTDGLYYTDEVRTEKISEGASQCLINKTGDWVVYMENGIYLKKGNAPKQKIAENASIVYASEDLNTIYYIVSGALYLLSDGTKLQKIIDKANSIIQIYEDGSFYYENTKEGKLKDIIVDDMAEVDAKIKRPTREEFKDEKAYEKASKRYEAKYDRDQIRDNLEMSVSMGNQLFYYTDGKSYLVSEDVFEYVYNPDYDGFRKNPFQANYSGNNRPLLMFAKLPKKNKEKLKMSEYDTLGKIYEKLSFSDYWVKKKYYICSEAEVIKELEGEFVTNGSVRFLPDLSGLYYIDTEDGSSGDLYYCSVEGDTVSSPQKMDEDVLVLGINYVKKHLVYFRNGNDNPDAAYLYIDFKKIDTDINLNRIQEHKMFTDQIVYYKKYSEGDQSYTLMVYDSGVGKKVADKVIDFKVVDDKTMVYISRVQGEPKKTGMFLYEKEGKTTLLEEGVDKLAWPNPVSYFAAKGFTEMSMW